MTRKLKEVNPVPQEPVDVANLGQGKAQDTGNTAEFLPRKSTEDVEDFQLS